MATQKEFEKFFKDNEKKAFRKINYQIQNEDNALDIVQDAMIKLIQNYQDKPIEEIAPLFYTILHNCLMDFLRRASFENKTFMNVENSDVEDPEGFQDNVFYESGQFEKDASFDFSQKESLKIIEAGLRELPERQRQAFLFRYLEELSVEETAEAMKCSEGSVKTHCFRAIQSLKNFLTKTKTK